MNQNYALGLAVVALIGAGYLIFTKPTGDTFDRIKGIKKAHADYELFVLWIKAHIDTYSRKKAAKVSKTVGELVNYEVEKLFAGAKALDERAKRLLEVEHTNVPVNKLQRASANLQKISA